MQCSSLRCETKPRDAMVWAFSMIKNRWPTACAWHADGEIWASLARAYNNDGFSACIDCTPEVREKRAADIKVWVAHGLLHVCASAELTAIITSLPQWRHRLQPSGRLPAVSVAKTVEPEVKPAEPTIEPNNGGLVEHNPHPPTDPESLATMADRRERYQTLVDQGALLPPLDAQRAIMITPVMAEQPHV